MIELKNFLQAEARRREDNLNVMRWRAPLLIAEVDTERLALIRDTEEIVIPMSGDGIRSQQDVAHLGNFHANSVRKNLSLVTVGEVLPERGWLGDTLIAFLKD